MLLNVVRYNNTNGITTVNYSTTNGTAVAGVNFYGITNGTLTFNPGDSVQPITLTTLHDTNVTGDLFFTVGLANPSGSAQLTSPSFTFVTDHDADAGISFLTNATERYRQCRLRHHPGANTNPNVEPVSVNYATGGGTRGAGQDYTAVSGTLSFTNGAALELFPGADSAEQLRAEQPDLQCDPVQPRPRPACCCRPRRETVTIIGTNTPPGLSFATPDASSAGIWGATNVDNTFGAPETGDPNIAGHCRERPGLVRVDGPARRQRGSDGGHHWQRRPPTA